MAYTKLIKYLEIRLTQLQDELDKNASEENTLIITKAQSELGIVLDMVKREKLLSVNPYSTD